MLAISLALIGVAMLYRPGVPANASGAQQPDTPVSKTAIANLPEKGLFTANAVDGKLYAFRFENDDSADAERLSSVGSVYAYDVGTGKWESRADMPVPKASYSAVALNGRIYVIGGLAAPGGMTGSVEIYDPNANRWTAGKDMPTARSRATLLVLDGKIYALGGKTKDATVTDAVEAYDPANNSWSAKRPLSRPAMGVAAAVANGKIYKLKGTHLDGAKFEFDFNFEEYDPASDTWTGRAPWMWEKEPLEFVAASGRLFAVGAGGYTDSTAHSLKEYVIASDRWVFRSEMPAASAHAIHPALTVLDGKIYVFGGGYREGKEWRASNLAQRYDPASDRWEELPPMAVGRVGVGVATASGKIFLLGGDRMSRTWNADRDRYCSLVEAYAPAPSSR